MIIIIINIGTQATRKFTQTQKDVYFHNTFRVEIEKKTYRSRSDKRLESRNPFANGFESIFSLVI